jgi:hypothetical protein
LMAFVTAHCPVCGYAKVVNGRGRCRCGTYLVRDGRGRPFGVRRARCSCGMTADGSWTSPRLRPPSRRGLALFALPQGGAWVSPTFWRGATRPRGPNRVQRLVQSERAFPPADCPARAPAGLGVPTGPGASIHSPAGFPDLVLCRPPRLVVAELKTATGKATLAQQEWLAALGACTGVEAALWRPADWSLIDATLA